MIKLAVKAPWVLFQRVSLRTVQSRSGGAASTFSEYIQLLPALPSLHPLRHEWPEDMLCGSLRKFYMEDRQKGWDRLKIVTGPQHAVILSSHRSCSLI